MRVPIRSIERQADIKRDALSLRFDLDARAADFPGSPVDADSHRCSFVGLRSTTRATHPAIRHSVRRMAEDGIAGNPLRTAAARSGPPPEARQAHAGNLPA